MNCKVFKNISLPETWLIKSKLTDWEEPYLFDIDLENVIYKLVTNKEDLNNKSKLFYYYVLIAYTLRGWIDDEIVTDPRCYDMFLNEVNDMLISANLPTLTHNDIEEDIINMYCEIYRHIEDLISDVLRELDFVYVNTLDMFQYAVVNSDDNFVSNVNVQFNYNLNIPNIKGIFCLLTHRKVKYG